MIRLRKRSVLSGLVHDMLIPISPEQYTEWKSGGHRKKVQEAFPNLSANHREFMISGITPAEWKEMASYA